jgi:hypothetical protein
MTIRIDTACVDSRDSFRKLPTGAVAFDKLVYSYESMPIDLIFYIYFFEVLLLI